MSVKRISAFACFALVFAAVPLSARAAEQDSLLKTADERIAANRKALVKIKIVDAKGGPIAGANVKVQQIRHAFLFGGNAFRFYYHADDRDPVYGARFSALFNYATLPFYWALYETEKGDSATYDQKHRRVIEWCKAYGIEMKGHPLIWHDLVPKWAPTAPDATRDALQRRIAKIVSQFKTNIHRWDVVNEATVAKNFKNGVGYWVKRDGAAKVVDGALRWVQEEDPAAELVYNDFNLGYDHQRLIEKLIQDDAPFQVIGLQSHMHRGEWPLEKVWNWCETYAKFGKSIHFSEVTVLSGEHGWELKRPWPTTKTGEQRQAEYVEQLYTLLFSHPAVQAITWWDLEDGAWQGAPAGLIRADLTPKPAYNRLKKLIKETWWTRESLKSDEKGVCAFSGFLGDYELDLEKGDISRTVQHTLVKGTNQWTVVMGE